jgi:hypothetical protein
MSPKGWNASPHRSANHLITPNTAKKRPLALLEKCQRSFETNVNNLPQNSHKVNAAQKCTHRTVSAEKAPAGHAKKAPTGRNEKAPTYYSPVRVYGVVLVVELKSMLSGHAQEEWCGNRAYGLLALISWFCHQGARPVRISAALADQYVSPIKRPQHRRTIREPLKLLCHLGLIEKTAPAVFAHVKISAEYRLAPAFAGKVHRFTELLPPFIAHKLQTAEERKEKRLETTYTFRRPLLADLDRLGLAPAARQIIAGLTLTKRGGSGLQNIVAAIDGRMHKISVDSSGTITTSISSLPRELKPHLTIDGEATASCDVSHMHHCFLPRILSDRIEHLRTHHPERDLSTMQAEHKRLVLALSGLDYYRSWCDDPADDDERSNVKREANTILNMPNRIAVAIALYQRMKRTYPHTFTTIENIKGADHRNISKQLRRFTSNAINGALVEVQSESIAAIPQFDAIICRQSDKDRVREIIGRHVFRESSGVRCKVNGILTNPACLPQANP